MLVVMMVIFSICVKPTDVQLSATGNSVFVFYCEELASRYNENNYLEHFNYQTPWSPHILISRKSRCSIRPTPSFRSLPPAVKEQLLSVEEIEVLWSPVWYPHCGPITSVTTSRMHWKQIFFQSPLQGISMILSHAPTLRGRPKIWFCGCGDETRRAGVWHRLSSHHAGLHSAACTHLHLLRPLGGQRVLGAPQYAYQRQGRGGRNETPFSSRDDNLSFALVSSCLP